MELRRRQVECGTRGYDEQIRSRYEDRDIKRQSMTLYQSSQRASSRIAAACRSKGRSARDKASSVDGGEKLETLRSQVECGNRRRLATLVSSRVFCGRFRAELAVVTTLQSSLSWTMGVGGGGTRYARESCAGVSLRWREVEDDTKYEKLRYVSALVRKRNASAR